MSSEANDGVAPKQYLALHLVGTALVAAAGFGLFGGLINAVLDNATIVGWDKLASGWIHERTSPTGMRVWNVVSQLGSPLAMTLLGVAGAVLLWRQRRHILLMAWSLAFVVGAAMNWVVKESVHRDRPPFAGAYVHAQTYSFPSGHAMGSIIGYGMTAYVITQMWRPGALGRRGVEVLAGAIVLLIGVSRLYLGVHYPSDVVGGWAAGGAWLAVCMSGSAIALRRESERVVSSPH